MAINLKNGKILLADIFAPPFASVTLEIDWNNITYFSKQLKVTNLIKFEFKPIFANDYDSACWGIGLCINNKEILNTKYPTILNLKEDYGNLKDEIITISTSGGNHCTPPTRLIFTFYAEEIEIIE